VSGEGNGFAWIFGNDPGGDQRGLTELFGTNTATISDVGLPVITINSALK